jgi:adenylate kinase
MQKFKILLVGPQGSGKGTQAARLATHFHIPALSMGELLREEERNGTKIGREIHEVMTHGGLVSDRVALTVIKKRLSADDAQTGYLIDGYPRNMAQYRLYHSFDRPTHIIVLDLSDAVAIRRLSLRRTCSQCGAVYHLKNSPPKKKGVCDVCQSKLIARVDDKPAAIKKRLNIYHAETKPLLLLFAKDGIPIFHINAGADIQKVTKDIMEIFAKHT